MKKQYEKKSSNKNNTKKAKNRLVCPLCYKDKKAKKLDDGYIVCAYCGLVLFKQLYSLECIDAPGFVDTSKIINKQDDKKYNHQINYKNYYHRHIKTLRNYINHHDKKIIK